MRDRSEQILRLACLVLAALAVAEICHAILRVNPLRGVTVPAVPTLVTNTVANTNSMTNGTSNSGPVDTNKIPAGLKTASSTNAAMATNVVVNSNSIAMTNHFSIGTNSVVPAVPVQTNETVQSTGTAPSATNKSVALKTGMTTNLVATNIVANTNSAPGTNSVVTNSATPNAPSAAHKHHSPRMMGGGMAGMMGMSGGSAVALPPLIQARVDQIVNSEMFAPVVHPQPMALLGIAGDTIFLRTDSGQSGLVKIGDSLGNVKLLRIGINRALVEQDGQKKELTIFDGFGSDSLLSTKDESSK